MSFSCGNCSKTFTRSYNLVRHQRESCKNRPTETDSPRAKRIAANPNPPAASTSTYSCTSCNISIPGNQVARHERTLQHRNNAMVQLSPNVHLIRSAFKCRISSYRIYSDNSYIDYILFFNDIKKKVLDILNKMLKIHRAIKVNMEVFGMYLLPSSETFSEKSFNTANRNMDQASDLDAIYQLFVDKMVAQTSEFQEKDSGKDIF